MDADTPTTLEDNYLESNAYPDFERRSALDRAGFVAAVVVVAALANVG